MPRFNVVGGSSSLFPASSLSLEAWTGVLSTACLVLYEGLAEKHLHSLFHWSCNAIVFSFRPNIGLIAIRRLHHWALCTDNYCEKGGEKTETDLFVWNINCHSSSNWACECLVYSKFSYSHCLVLTFKCWVILVLFILLHLILILMRIDI